MATKLPYEEFFHRVFARHGNNFAFSESNFKSGSQPITVVCKRHEKTLTVNLAYTLAKSNPCKECRKGEKLEIYKKKIDRSLALYYPKCTINDEINNSNSTVSMKCSIHGSFLSNSDAIIYNRARCPACRKKEFSAKMTGQKRVKYEEFRNRFENRYGNKISLLTTEVDFNGISGLISMRCSNADHPDIEMTARNSLRYNGCKRCNESAGERLVRLALEKIGVKFHQQMRFPSCRDKMELPFDFWLPEYGAVIEFQGLQHEIPWERIGGEEALIGIQRRDNIKKNWAKENKVELIYIKDHRKVKYQIMEQLRLIGGEQGQDAASKVMKSDEAWINKKWASYLKRLNKVHEHKYDFSDTTWTKGQLNVDFRCAQHGIRNAALQSLLKGTGCAACKGQEVSLEEVIGRSREKFGERFEFSNSDFSGMSEPMKIVCTVHGIINISPERHLRLTQGCVECSKKAPDFSPENFLKKAREKFGERFDYSKLDYKSTSKRVQIICNKHAYTFETLPGDHIRGNTGCCKYCVRDAISLSKGKSIIVEGVSFPSLTAAAMHYRQDTKRVEARISKGWDINKAFTVGKIPKFSKPVNVSGLEFKSMKEAAKHFGIEVSTVNARIKRGWNVIDAFTMPLSKKT